MWVSEPVVKNLPFMPGRLTVVMDACSPTSTLPWNCPDPTKDAVVASGRFHSSRSRYWPSVSLPLVVLMTRFSPTTLTRTVASSGMPANSMDWLPLGEFGLTRSKSTLNTWSCDVPSPVNSVR